MKKIIVALIFLLNVIPTVWAQSFIVQNIEVQGLQRISSATVRSYLPLKLGQTLGPDKTASVIRALYNTGFFEHISLSRRGNTLIINVEERPTIGHLTITGNSFIATDKLTSVMKSLDIAEGRVYNRLMLDRIQQSLLNQYYELGRYNARVKVTATPMDRCRMLVRIDISEGLVAKVRCINIIGNHAFKESVLIKKLSITTPGLFTFITQTDRYNQEKLDASLESLRNFYLDQGYLRFVVKSSQVAITPDRKSIYLTIVVDEGVPYCVKGISVNGETVLPQEEIIRQIHIRQGDRFSRQAVIDSEKAITDVLGNKGYVFATVSINPRIDDVAKNVFLGFDIRPGKRAYVRNIYFTDNAKTNDEALRREIQQMEGAVVSTCKLEDSKRRLNLLPYLKDAQMTVIPVPGTDDQVDVNYKVVEDNAAQANVSLGFSQQYGIQLGAGLNQKNFLGTGKTLGLNFTKNRFEQFYGITYTDPYYTLDGISRTLGLSVSKVDPGQTNASGSYTLNQYVGSVLYSIPIGNEIGVFNHVQLGYGYENTVVHLTNSVSTQVANFVNNNGSHFGQFDLIAGLSRNSLNKAIFPTRGVLHTFGVNAYFPAGTGHLTYYTMGYNVKGFYPLTDSFIATAKGQLGYGNAFNGVSNFPFFKNYYAGGIDSVRGYLGNTLGPKDSMQKPTGGNALVTASIGMIFPNYISENFRTTLFVDAGNVYDTSNNRPYGGTGSGPLRYSTGIEGDWLTPFGLINVSLAKPLNRQTGRGVPSDSEEIFQFSLGANL